MEEKTRRIYKWSQGEKEGPVKIELSYTKKCNLNCFSCWRRRYKNGEIDYSEEISEERCLELIEEAKDIGVKEIYITGGGEPLAKKELFWALVKKIKEYGMKGVLITNGTLFDEKLIEKLIKIGWDDVIFSLDGPDFKTNDLLRKGERPFKKVIEALQHFDRYKIKHDCSLPKVRLSPVISNRNYHKLPEFVQLASEENVESINFQLLVDNNDITDIMALNKKERKELHKLIPKTLKMADKEGVLCNADDLYDEGLMENSSSKKDIIKSQGSGFPDSEFLSLPCYRPWYFMSIYPEGNVQPCPDIPQREGDYENVDNEDMKEIKKENVKDKSLKEIWYGSYFNEYRKNLLDKNMYPWCQICCGNEVFDIKGMRKKLARRMEE